MCESFGLSKQCKHLPLYGIRAALSAAVHIQHRDYPPGCWILKLPSSFWAPSSCQVRQQKVPRNLRPVLSKKKVFHLQMHGGGTRGEALRMLPVKTDFFPPPHQKGSWFLWILSLFARLNHYRNVSLNFLNLYHYKNPALPPAPKR